MLLLPGDAPTRPLSLPLRGAVVRTRVGPSGSAWSKSRIPRSPGDILRLPQVSGVFWVADRMGRAAHVHVLRVFGISHASTRLGFAISPPEHRPEVKPGGCEFTMSSGFVGPRMAWSLRVHWARIGRIAPCSKNLGQVRSKPECVVRAKPEP